MSRRLESIGLVLLAFFICAMAVAWAGGLASLSAIAGYLVPGAILVSILAWRLAATDSSEVPAREARTGEAGRDSEPSLRSGSSKPDAQATPVADSDLFARELHDDISEHVSAIKSMGVSINRRADDPAMTEASQLIVESADRIENAMRDVLDRNRQGSRKVLSEAVSETVDSFKKSHSEKNITLRLSPEVDQAEPATTNAAHRIAHASLENAVMHSGGDHIEVSLRVQDQSLIVQVADNGIGMPGSLDADRAGGLNAMGDRASAVGGVFEVGKSRLGGVAARAKLPLASEAGANGAASA